MKRLMIIGAAVFAASCTLANTQNWSANPVSAEWSTTAANWDDGLAWTPTNKAVFGESAQKSVHVPSDVVVDGVVVNANGYRFSGAGSIATPEHGWSSATTQRQSIDVAEGVSADFDVPIAGASNNGVFTKKGGGTAVISRNVNFLRVVADEGNLVISNCVIETAKIHDESTTSSKSHLVLDGVSLRPMNNNVILGDMDRTSIGAGGVSLVDSGAAVSNVRIKQSIGTRPELGGVADGGLTHNSSYTLWIDSIANMFSGGCFFLCGMNYLAHADGLGSGPVTLNTPLYAMDTMTITNDVVIGDGGILGVSNSTVSLAVANPSFAAGKADRIVTLSSAAEGGSVMFGANSLPVSGYILRNGVDLLADGNTLMVAPGVQSPYVRAENGQSRLVLGPNGGTIDTDGNDIALGVPCAFAPLTEMSTAFSNYSFEDASTEGWTFGKGTAGVGNRYANTSGFVSSYPAYKTPYGSYFAVARSGGGTIEKTFSVESDGKYRIVFDYACRPGYDPNGQLQFALYLNHGATDEIVLRPMTAVGSNHPFERYETDFVSLEADKPYAFKLLTGDSIDTVHGYDCFLVDRVRLERMNSPVLTKRGVGTLLLDALSPSLTATVEAGTLAVCARAFESNVVNVANGATLAFSNPTVAISNASFEVDSEISSGTFVSTGMVAGWTMSVVAGTTKSGWQANGSSVSPAQPWTTNGSHTVFLRPTTAIETDVAVEYAGEYELSFEHSSRAANDSSGKGCLLKITASVDGSEALVVPPREANGPFFVRASARVALTAGTHRLRIETDNGNGSVPNSGNTVGSMVFIDAVSLAVVSGDVVDASSTWNFECGATVDLCGNNVELGKVKVDGKVVTGGSARFSSAGLNVIGRGKLISGPPAGTTVIVR